MMCIFAKKKSTIMEHKYSQVESETPKVSEPVIPRVCSIKERSIYMCFLFHRAYHALDKGDFILVQVVFLV